MVLFVIGSARGVAVQPGAEDLVFNDISSARRVESGGRRELDGLEVDADASPSGERRESEERQRETE
ncbi:hypothetical protein CH63R_11597 [Colletotrichum higginsianum IMI 349063]|uniref:Uncharacterized protein n=1 Tax=Colletotrichum higginsianum (strain IMI 349063) TaxID=759273 RepID=A0A1B7XYS4_COLHI|nr:hypothetical protein CH63R_11597 [Colletotrichum higginsianum IMI 349063]OBR04894.1 hypothetical protein CH63R_11597 [Colletotrichum higginsianum IMI 349063]